MKFEEKNAFEEVIFKKESCQGCDLRHKTFSHCTFENCDFTKSAFTGSKFFECKMKNCNLSLIKLEGVRLQNLIFEECKFVGVNFGKCDPMFLSLKFLKSLFDTSNFSDLNLKGALFQECVIRNCHFTNCNLSGADFSKSDLSGTIFHHANLSAADFRSAINYYIDPLTNTLKKAKFSSPEVLALLQNFEIEID